MRFVIGLILSTMLAGGAQAAPKSDARAETLKDLKEALQGETTASYKYRQYAQQAGKEGYSDVAKLFRAASESEAIHRENHKKAIAELGGPVPNVVPQVIEVRSTRENLEEPIHAEASESKDMYPRFIGTAKQAKAETAAKAFLDAKNAEMQHEQLFRDALSKLGKNSSHDYYVNKKTGATVAIPAGATLHLPDVADYKRIG